MEDRLQASYIYFLYGLLCQQRPPLPQELNSLEREAASLSPLEVPLHKVTVHTLCNIWADKRLTVSFW